MEPNIAIIGDAFLEEFRPVRKKNDTTVKARVPVYESEPGYKDLRTHSPGGAAFLATLLVPLSNSAIVSVPANTSSELAQLLARTRTLPQTPADFHFLPVNQRHQSRIQGFYTRDHEDLWRLASRCDELYDPLPYESISIPEREIEFLIVDDHSRGAITHQLLRDLLTLRPARIIISAQRVNARLYQHLMPNPENTIVVCTDRQALLWTDIELPPPRFPQGTPEDHLSLFRRIYSKMRNDLPWAHDIIVTFGAPLLSCLQFTAEGGGCVIKYYGPDQNEDEQISTPGITTFFLAALAANLMHFSSTDAAIDLAMSAAAIYGADGIRPRAHWFGRLEELPPSAVSLARKPILIGTINKLDPEIWTGASDLLEYAQLYGRLPATNSALPDYFAPPAVDQKISALVDSLVSFISRADRKRPFNILVTAGPGSGKSFFAQCLARRLEMSGGKGRTSAQHPLLETNLSLVDGSLPTDAALIELYSEVRDQRALGRIPVVLIDEFDALMPMDTNGARPDAMDKLFARMLAPLWDGLFILEGRYRRLGGFILLVVASSETFVKRLDEGKGKARDFASRIDVRLDLPDIGSFLEPDRIEAQVRMAVAMLKKHMGTVVKRVELAVLDAIGRAHFPRRNRAIDQLIMLSSLPTDGTFRLENLAKEQLLEYLVQGLKPDASKLRYGRSWVPVE